MGFIYAGLIEGLHGIFIGSMRRLGFEFQGILLYDGEIDMWKCRHPNTPSGMGRGGYKAAAHPRLTGTEQARSVCCFNNLTSRHLPNFIPSGVAASRPQFPVLIEVAIFLVSVRPQPQCMMRVVPTFEELPSLTGIIVDAVLRIPFPKSGWRKSCTTWHPNSTVIPRLVGI